MPDAADPPRPRFSVNPVAVIVVCAVGLTILGLISLFSASAYFKEGPYFYLGKQLVGVVLAIGLGWIASRVNLDYLRRYVWIIGGISLLLLVAVLVPHLGVSVKGSRRWLGFGPLRLQVSEFAKLAMVFCLAHYVAINQTKIEDLKRGYLYPLGIIGIFSALVLKEPDFGTAALILIVGLTLLFLAGARWRFILPTVFLALVVFGVAMAHNANRLQRFVAFLDVEGNKQGGTYQLYQSEAAFAAGGTSGVGLGNGRQQHNFLPESNNDFIAAVIGEELGLRATLAVVLLFTTMFVAGLVHLRRAPNLFQFLLATGCLLLICLQAIVNLGVVTGLFPTKGMSLPFISAGLSNLLLMGLLLGILANTQRRWSRPALTMAGGEFNETAPQSFSTVC
ncbi:MAG TPA: putative peptidoglycan glycosyltransferase FtsW [Opitutaceae bacterium]|nr:putative peptidoglycan glycosyltransferase FtsW [Opitutaceae bacterium]